MDPPPPHPHPIIITITIITTSDVSTIPSASGFGRGLTYAPGLIIVGMYFNRHRGLGVGLATAGVGAGTFVLPPLVDFLFEEFGLSGAFLVLGGLSLNFCVVAMLYRPLFVHRRIVLGARGRRGSVTADELLGKGAREGTEQRGVFLDEDNDDGDVADEGTLLNNARDKIKQHDEGSSQRLHRQDLDEDDAASGQKNSPHTVPLSANEIHARTSARARVHLITGTSSPANHTHHNGENAASPSPVTRKRKKIFASKQILSGLKRAFPWTGRTVVHRPREKCWTCRCFGTPPFCSTASVSVSSRPR